jgi:hypothetical protein
MQSTPRRSTTRCARSRRVTTWPRPRPSRTSTTRYPDGRMIDVKPLGRARSK